MLGSQDAVEGALARRAFVGAHKYWRRGDTREKIGRHP